MREDNFTINIFNKNNQKPQDNKDVANLFFYSHKYKKDYSCYLFCKEFSSQLKKVDLKILPKYLFNKEETLYVEFGESIELSVFKIKGFVCLKHKEFIDICFFSPIPNGHVLNLGIVIPNHPLFNTIEDIMNRYISDDCSDLFDVNTDKKNLTHLLKYSINCILYIGSGNPDLRLLKKIKKNFKSKKGEKKHRKKNPIEGNLIEVGFNYKKSVLFNIESTNVKGHFRWQPYGKQLSLIKLIWIAEHKRKFKNTKTNFLRSAI